jgi:hypothetical protein
VDTENDSAALGICEADGRVGEQVEGLLWTSGYLLEIQLLSLELGGRDSVDQLSPSMSGS